MVHVRGAPEKLVLIVVYLLVKGVKQSVLGDVDLKNIVLISAFGFVTVLLSIK